ncbi:helix-hairpin-helix domain-containing protein [Nocardioides ferulae]|uniref:helix-hairpin-helix domain-containing protein n=1 Tax=Nocardioides ferulae TaxID=2340821 RepID=UPI000EB12529|nr:helix-hairpin-helix domain-containing protein [Nocardioides ferulae]
MNQVFNPPPNWPKPAPGWSPPPGWQPDPAWGPPPAGWPLWIPAGVRPQTLTVGGPVPGPADPGNVGLGVLVALLPIFTCSLASFAPPLRAAIRRPEPRFRAAMLITAAVLEAVALTGFALIGTAPDGPDGSPEGPASDIAVVLVLVAMVTSVAIGFVYLRDSRARGEHRPRTGVSTAVAVELARRERREEYRRLALEDPGLARGIHVGRPDLPRDYDDGGLLDLNHVDAAQLVSLAGLTAAEAAGVVAVREQLGAFTTAEEVFAYADLGSGAAARLRDLAVVL